MKESMTLLNENNQEITCNIIAKWSHNNNNYIAYTDGTKEQEKLNLFISKYIIDNNNLKLEEITNDEEWEYVNQFLNEHLYENEE